MANRFLGFNLRFRPLLKATVGKHERNEIRSCRKDQLPHL
jgi:hypothetical protein